MITQNSPSRRRSWASLLAAKAALVLGLSLAAAGAIVAPAQAANPHERGPNPTESSITAERGSFQTTTTRVSSLVSGFGGGTIYYPTDTSQGTFGGVVVTPGFSASQSQMSWFGHRIASQGFVVFTIDTNSRLDQPASRGRQIDSALDYLATSSSVADRVDGDRMAVMGHSMGGGGSLEAAVRNDRVVAAIPMTPYHDTKNWSRIDVPTLVIGAQNDVTASPRNHAIPIYESLPRSLDRAYMELRGEGHLVVISSNTPIARQSIAWLKRFVDNDERYEQFLCPPPRTGLFTDYSDYRDSCPHGS